MDELLAINKVSAALGISSRALRYWEDAGLFRSTRDPQSGWRTYDADALQCIRLTDLLRRLDIPVRDIRQVMEKRTADTVRDVLGRKLSALERTGAELALQRGVLLELLAAIRAGVALSLPSLEGILAPVVAQQSRPGPEKMKELTTVNRLDTTIASIRIIELAPMRTAAFSTVGAEPEDAACAPVLQWVTEQKLLGTMRLFGFNVEPYPSEASPEYGFGYCATVPEGISIPEPLYEWRLPGGVYAALETPPGGDPSRTWGQFKELMDCGKWEWEYDRSRHPGLEEHVRRGDGEGYRIAVTLPVKRR